jgi:hypothetical protein
MIQVLKDRVAAEPFNLVATLIFFGAIIHTFLAPAFTRLAQRLGHKGRAVAAELCHFLGEVEAIFGIWVVPLMIAMTLARGWTRARDYLGHDLNFTEPLFVVVIMTIAASRPVLELAEKLMALAAGLGQGSLAAWWVSILTVGPLLGSLITEPAAMTICALLLAKKFYARGPSVSLAYATIGLLFVNVSVGGVLTHFAAPPVLMVAGKWGWGLSHMLRHFGWKAVAGIVVANGCYFLWFRRQLIALEAARPPGADAPELANEPGAVPVWITMVHLLFLLWTVLNNHYPVLFIGGFLFYLAFARATEPHQGELALRPALLVGFFLAGLVAHGGLQGWWIGPVLKELKEVPLFIGAVILTSFNDNAAITYLASFVPGITASLQYAVVAGAVVGGGLTVIANAPNPAGQSILSKFFPDGVSPWGLFKGALVPTAIMAAAFLLLG